MYATFFPTANFVRFPHNPTTRRPLYFLPRLLSLSTRWEYGLCSQIYRWLVHFHSNVHYGRVYAIHIFNRIPADFGWEYQASQTQTTQLLITNSVCDIQRTNHQTRILRDLFNHFFAPGSFCFLCFGRLPAFSSAGFFFVILAALHATPDKHCWFDGVRINSKHLLSTNDTQMHTNQSGAFTWCARDTVNTLFIVPWEGTNRRVTFFLAFFRVTHTNWTIGRFHDSLWLDRNENCKQEKEWMRKSVDAYTISGIYTRNCWLITELLYFS